VTLTLPPGPVAGVRAAFGVRGEVANTRSPEPGAARAAAAPASLLDVRNLRKRYGSRTVVQDVSLAVGSGEVVGLLGPNGAGKTTSFYMILGLVRADAGQILIDGQPVAHMPIHRRSRLGLSYLPQEASIFRKLTVAENVRAVLELQRGPDGRPLPREEIEQRLTDLLEQLHVADLRDSPAPALSGGERRRVEIARALATQPRLILLDEPFAGIDPIAVIEIQRIIAFLKQRGIGVLITDHNVRETLGICDHAVIISNGRVLAAGTPEAIVANPEVRRVYLGEHFRL
jgi:lipopolysaccharide export system ATP-binding protein